MSDREPRRLLILGGTGEAAALARVAARVFGARLAVTTSLAGRLAPAADLPGAVRVGGFGGPAGLAAHLREGGYDLVVDATHPFACRISANARAACAEAGLPLLSLRRPEWRRRPGDRWIEVDDMAAAAARLPTLGRCALLAVGIQELDAFAGVEGVRLVVRLAAPPARPLPLPDHLLVVARGPFSLAEEARLLAAHAIDVVVSKASGGNSTAAKIAAARRAGLPVLMVRRPPPEPGATVASVEEALAWIAATAFN